MKEIMKQYRLTWFDWVKAALMLTGCYGYMYGLCAVIALIYR